MMDRLKAAHDEFFAAPAEDKKAALERYLSTLVQFNALMAHGEFPPVDIPAYGHSGEDHGRPVD